MATKPIPQQMSAFMSGDNQKPLMSSFLVTTDNSQKNKPFTYADAGVDIEAGNALVKNIAPLAKSTMRTGADVDLGGFGGLFDLAACKFDDPVLVAGNDGVGTKLKVAIEANKHDTVGIDLVAMCANDLIVQGAEPLFFLDYFASGKLDTTVATTVIAGIAEGCRQSNCALIGGETAEMPDMYAPNDYDLAGFCVGAVERAKILPKKDISDGDVILGLASSGVHSNGFSLIRRLVESAGLAWDDPSPANTGITLAEDLLTPTRLYVKSVLAALHDDAPIKGLVHITGGGFQENLPRVIENNLAAHIDLTAWDVPPIFQWIKDTGNIEELEMLRTFNCGIGMALIVPESDADAVMKSLAKNGEKSMEMGRIAKRTDDAVMFSGALFK